MGVCSSLRGDKEHRGKAGSCTEPGWHKNHHYNDHHDDLYGYWFLLYLQYLYVSHDQCRRYGYEHDHDQWPYDHQSRERH